MDLSFFLTPEAWISLGTLTFLEIVLGVDNIVFISLTSDRLPAEKRHIGRKLGLAGAFIMRSLFLCFASFLAGMRDPFYTLAFGSFSFAISVHDLIMFFGGAYLIYKGITELRDTLNLVEEKAGDDQEQKEKRQIGLPQAVATIMVMDIVFSIDSVITAVGLANQLIIMILAVFIAIIIMMIFIDPIANFITSNVEMKVLALVFISVIGILLFCEGLHLQSTIYVFGMHVEKVMIYFAMIFSLVLELVQMRRRKNLRLWLAENAADHPGEIEDVVD